MNISRFLKEEMIILDLQTKLRPPPEDSNSDKWRNQNKEQLLSDLVGILELSGKISNRSKLLSNFINRERKASTAIGSGVAIPHVRSMQAKEFIFAFARSTSGYEFDSVDNELTHLFFIMASPPYDDNLYLKVFKALAESLQYETFRKELMQAKQQYDIIHLFKQME